MNQLVNAAKAQNQKAEEAAEKAKARINELEQLAAANSKETTSIHEQVLRLEAELTEAQLKKAQARDAQQRETLAREEAEQAVRAAETARVAAE